MTYEEAISRIKKIADSSRDVSSVGMFEQRPIVTAFDMAKEALEKQIPKKPLRGYTCKANNDSWRSCPFCHARQWNTHKYCSQCGQALDWSH